MKTVEFIKLQCYSLENYCQFVCRDLTKEDFVWRSESGSPGIGWLLGHVIGSHDFLANHLFLENPPILSKEISSLFNIKTVANFPNDLDSQVLFDQLKKINKEVVSTLSQKSDDFFDQIPTNQDRFPSVMKQKNYAKLFIFHFTHAFSHMGQILEIRRMLGKEVWTA